MRYSEIIGSKFYNIALTKLVQEMVDIHFTASSHHYWRISDTDYIQEQIFHSVRYREHLFLMMEFIYKYGDFINAVDPSFRGLDFRESWNPRKILTALDPNIFNSMVPDFNFRIAEPHVSDIFLSIEVIRFH